MDSPCEVRDRATGWLVSFAVHAAGIVLASVMMKDLHLAPQPEPFRWELSMVQPPAPKSSVVPPSPPTPPQKVSPPNKTVQNPVDRPVPRVVETQRVVRNVQTVPHVEQQQILRNVEPTVQSETAPTEVTQPQETQVRQVESIHQVSETQVVAVNAPPSTVTAPVMERPHQVVEEASRPVAHESVQSSEATIVEQQSTITEKSVNTMETAATENVPLPVERTTVQETSAVEPSRSPIPVAEPVQQAAIQTAPPRATSSRKVDYTWLVEALSSRVGQFKKYPFIARTNRWEGLVVLRATISHEGKLVDVAVLESSGHALLDQDAMDVMRKSCPLHLEHPLGRPQVEIQVPISYQLR